jgi:hypothetical protein
MALLVVPNRFDHGILGRVFHDSLRTLQFIFAIIVAVIYGIDLQHASSLQARAHPSWVFAEVAAALSAITCLIHCLFPVRRVVRCILDFALAVLWAACFGSFAVYFLAGRETIDSYEMTTSSSRMKAGAWIDLVNTILWFISAVSCCTCSKAGFQQVQDVDERQRTESQMEDAYLEEQSQEGDLERRWSELPSYSNSVGDEWKVISVKSSENDSDSLKKS